MSNTDDQPTKMLPADKPATLPTKAEANRQLPGGTSLEPTAPERVSRWVSAGRPERLF